MKAATNDELVRLAETFTECNLRDDALVYQGSCTIDRWECHVPMIVCQMWEHLDKPSRAAVFLTAINAVITCKTAGKIGKLTNHCE